MLPRLGWHISPDAALTVVEALGAKTERLHPSLEALGVPAPPELVVEIAPLANLARRAIREGPASNRRIFR